MSGAPEDGARGAPNASGAAPAFPVDGRAWVGLMSGTSCDGISAAAVRFVPGPSAEGAPLGFELLAHVQHPYAGARRERLLAAMAGATPAEYCRLHRDLGDWLADAAADVIAAAGLGAQDVGAVASHGQTLWHEPGHSTWQVGDASVVAERLGVDVVHDFRVRDVAAGGQGAPLVPIADALLFAGRGWRALQNLGGMGNVTVVPPHGGDPWAAPDAVAPDRRVFAFDTGPACALVDLLARRARPDWPYDVDGALARAGTPVDAAVEACLADSWFAAPPPKSTGREKFGAAYADALAARARAERPDATDADLVATAVALTARSVADAYARFVPSAVDDVLLSGGGAHNPALVDAIAAACAARGVRAAVRPFDAVFCDAEAKEAVAFALMGYLHAHGLPGNVPAATGARGARVLGARTPAAASWVRPVPVVPAAPPTPDAA